MRFKIESYMYDRDFGSFSVVAKEGEEEKFAKAVELICAKDEIANNCLDEYEADFSYCKSMYSEECLREMWKQVKKDIKK